MHALLSESLKGRRGVAARVLLTTVVVALLVCFTGCYGRFPMTRAIYDLNGRIGQSIEGDETQNKLAQSIVFWIFNIVPVYGFATLGDAVVLNVIEFWTGKTMYLSEAEGAHGRVAVLQPAPDGRTAMLNLMQGERVLESQRLVRVSDEVLELRDAEGRLLGTMERAVSGGVDLRDGNGVLIRHVAAGEVRG